VAASKIRYRLNIRAVLILAAIGLVTALGLYVFWGYQENRILEAALMQAQAFQSAKVTDPDQKAHNNELALRHLIPYLDARPHDRDGLALEAELLTPAAESTEATTSYAQLLEALRRNRSFLASGAFNGTASVYEHLLRVEPAGPRAQNARRHLAAIYILSSDYLRMDFRAQLMPEAWSKLYKYLTAKEHALHLLKEDAKAKVPDEEDAEAKRAREARTAEAHQLYALALEGQIIPGETERRAPVAVRGKDAIDQWDVTLEDGAILEFENALELQPGDLITATHLTGLYQRASRKNADIAPELEDRLEADFARRLPGYELRLVSRVNNVSAIPKDGRNSNLMIVAEVGNVLHFRIFTEGKRDAVVDTDETKPALSGQRQKIEELRKRLNSLWPPHELTRRDQDQVKHAVAEIVSYTRLAGLDPKDLPALKKKLIDLLRAHPAARRLADLYQGSGYDLRSMSWGDGSGVPTSGNNLVIVGTDAAGLLHIRVFNAGGNRVTDKDETQLPGTQAGAISALKQKLPGLLPPHVLTDAEKAQVLQEVTSILGQTQNSDIAMAVLDRLLNASEHPANKSVDARKLVDVRRARYAFFNGIGDSQAAMAELEEAVLLDPENLELLLTAVENAWRSSARGTDDPHFWLDQVSGSSRDDLRYLSAKGMVEYTEKDHEGALKSWRKGLELSNFSDANLCRQLALALVELNRDDEAAKIVEQYRRLVPDTDPALRFLEGVQDEHAGRYSRAIERLGWARDRLPTAFQTPIALYLGRSQERQGDRPEAEKTYRAALRLDPGSTPLRQALGRLLMATQPQDAIREFEQVLASNASQPGALLSLAEARLREQKALPQERRNWADFDAVFNRAAAVLPADTDITLVLLKAERLAADARPDEAISLLQKEFDKLREEVAKLRKEIAKLEEEVAKESGLKGQLDGKKAALESSASRLVGLTIRLTEYRFGRGQVDQALTALEQASDPKAAGDRGLFRVQRALILSNRGQGQEARAALLKDVNRLPPAERESVWTFLVLLLRRQGDPKTSRDAFNTWAQLLPEDPKPKLALLELEIAADDQKAIQARLESLRPRSNEQDDFMWRLVQARQRLREAQKETDAKKRRELLQEADTLVDSVLHDFKVDPVWLLLKGQILEAEGAVERAANAYSQAYARFNIDSLFRLVDLWTRLGRKEDLERLRQDDKTGRVDQIEAITFLNYGDRNEAARIIEESLRQNPGRQSWQVGLLEYLGKDQEAEATLRSNAEQPQQSGQLEPWLALIRFQANPRPLRTAPSSDRSLKVNEILAELKPLLRKRWQPELLEAECLFAAADWLAADRAFSVARARYPQDPEVQDEAKLFAAAAQKKNLEAADACLSRLKSEAYIARFKPLLKDRLPELLEAQCHFAAADWPAADQAFDAARKRYPDVAEVQAEAARYQAQKGHEGAADACLRHLEAGATIAAIRPYLTSKWPELLEAQCFWATANWPAADQAFDVARKRYPDVAEVQTVAARYQELKEREDAADACLRRLKVEATIAEIKQRVKSDWPELLEAECRWTANDFPKADLAFAEAVKRYPDVPIVQAEAARYYEQRGRPDKVEACLRRILARNPGERDAIRNLAVVLTNQSGRPDAWKQALELLGPEGSSPNTPEERLARAIVLGRSEQPDLVKRAIDILHTLIADMPAGSAAVITAREMLIRFLLATGDPVQASNVAGSIALQTDNPAAIIIYAETLLQSRQFEAAQVQGRRLEQLDPRNPYLTNLRARLIVAQSKPTEAAAALEGAYLATDDSTKAEQFGREIFPMLLRMGPDAQPVAERLARRLAEHNPALSWMTASILANRGQRDEALALCRTAVEAGTQPLDLREACRIALNLAVASPGETTVLQRASECTETARRHAREYDDLRVIQAMLCHLQGRFDEEVRLYRAVLANQPHDLVALNNLAWALSEGLNQPSEGLEKIDELLAIVGRKAEQLDTRGVILTRLDRLEEAVNDLKEAIKLESSGIRLYHLAKAYKKMGREEDFRRTFEEARRAGLTTPITVDPTERAEIEALLKS
jgi:tetratricopeptide (TPR) repeat protein